MIGRTVKASKDAVITTAHIGSFLVPTLSMEKAGKWEPINKVTSEEKSNFGSIYISRLPCRGEQELFTDKIKEESAPLKLVVSVVDEYEINDTLPSEYLPLMNPIRPEEWKAKGIDQIRLEMTDFSSGSDLDFDVAARLVHDIQKVREKGGSVLIHCKAGRTRSAMLASCVVSLYDLLQNPENHEKPDRELVDLAIAKMTENRVQLKVHEENRVTAAKIVNAAKKQHAFKEYKTKLTAFFKAYEEKHNSTLKPEINKLFADESFKKEILELQSFKDLCVYKSKLLEGAYFNKSHRANQIVKLIEEATEAKDSSWLISVLKTSGPTKELISAKPYFNVTDPEKDQTERESLINKLKKDAMGLLCKKLNCDEHDLYSSLKIKRSASCSSLKI